MVLWMEERWDFDLWVESYDEDVMSDGWIYSDYERVFWFVVERVKGVVVDVGCGMGNIFCFFCCECYIGVEFLEGMWKVFCEKWGFEFIDGYFFEIFFLEGSVDIVVSIYVFYYVFDEEKGEVIREMFCVLRLGGILIIVDVMFELEDEKRCIGEEDGILEEVLEKYFNLFIFDYNF